jgi:hypothetical protein
VASIHLTEIQRLLAERGEMDAEPHSEGGYFVEIRFDQPGPSSGPVDPEFQNKVVTVDCPYGTVTIQFDHEGQLSSIDVT